MPEKGDGERAMPILLLYLDVSWQAPVTETSKEQVEGAEDKSASVMIGR